VSEQLPSPSEETAIRPSRSVVAVDGPRLCVGEPEGQVEASIFDDPSGGDNGGASEDAAGGPGV
jgi:hypothetical protein